MGTHVEKVMIEIYQNVKGKPRQVQTIIRETDKLTGKLTERVRRLDKKTGEYNWTQTKVIKGMKRFRYEALGIMFGGMAIERAFGKITKAGMDLYGISELLNTALGTTMLPVLDLLGPVIFDIVDAIMNMSDAEKMAFGGLVLFGQAIGTMLMSLGQVILFVSSLEKIGGLAGLFANIKDIFAKMGQYVGKKLVTTIGIKGFEDVAAGGLMSRFSSLLKTKLGLAFTFTAGGFIAFLGILSLVDVINEPGFSQQKLISIAETALGVGIMARSARAGAGTFLVISSLLLLRDIDRSGEMTIERLAQVIASGLGVSTAMIMFGASAPAGFVIGISAALVIDLYLDPGFRKAVASYWEDIRRTFEEQGPIAVAVKFFTEPSAPGFGARMARPPSRLEFNIFRALLGEWGGPSISIPLPWAQKGAIVTRPSIVGVGEAGPEAIIPLDRAGGMGETNIYATYNIEANIHSDADLRDLAHRLNEYLVSDYRRQIIG